MPAEQSLAKSVRTENDLLESLVSTNRAKRINAAVELDDRRMQLVQKLIAILNSTNAANVKVDAVIVLGEYRAPEVVPLLVEHFEWDEAARGGIF